MAFVLANTKKDGSKSKAASEIIAVIKTLRSGKKYANVKTPTACKELSQVINSNFNTNLVVMINPRISANANMSIPLLTRNNPMWNEMYREYFPEALESTSDKMLARKSSDIIAGEIKADGTLGGDFAKLEGTINISLDMIFVRRWKVTPEGACGVILHEIGHFINFLRALTWTCRTNYVLAQLNQRVLGNVPRDQKIKIMQQISTKEELDIDDDIKQVAKLDNDSTVCTIFVGAMNRKMRSELGDDVYNSRGFESLSDNFAAQHGCGLDLVLALDSMPNMYMSRKTTIKKLLTQIMSLALKIIMWIFIPLYMSLAAVITILSYRRDEVIYDDPKNRFRRIAVEMIATLRENRNGDTTKQIADIEQIFATMENYGEKKGNLQALDEYLTPGGRSAMNIRQLNQTLEDMNANKLYLSAAKFKNV